jgi:hypothetical protein
MSNPTGERGKGANHFFCSLRVRSLLSPLWRSRVMGASSRRDTMWSHCRGSSRCGSPQALHRRPHSLHSAKGAGRRSLAQLAVGTQEPSATNQRRGFTQRHISAIQLPAPKSITLQHVHASERLRLLSCSRCTTRYRATIRAAKEDCERSDYRTVETRLLRPRTLQQNPSTLWTYHFGGFSGVTNFRTRIEPRRRCM